MVNIYLVQSIHYTEPFMWGKYAKVMHYIVLDI